MKDKKYGVVIFKNTENLGDDIQTYAAYKQIGNVDYYIERERLNEFVSENGEIVNVLMSGWYIHDVFSFPPSPFINPLYLSCHFTNHLIDEKPEYLSNLFVEHLKKYEPIGLRDNTIEKYFKEDNIEHYFSGCLTLTIPKIAELEKKDYICAVDLKEEEIEFLKKITKRDIIEVTHKLNKEEHAKLSPEERMKKVEEFLKTYQQASLVISKRLHVALPCLAIETPVLLLINKKDIDKTNRIGIYYDYLNVCDEQDFYNYKEEDLIKIKKNPDKYKSIREKLIERVEEFKKKKSIISEPNTIEKEKYTDYFVKQKQYFSNMYETIVSKKDKWIDELEEYIDELKRENNKNNMLIDVYIKERNYAVENYTKRIDYYTALIKDNERERDHLREVILEDEEIVRNLRKDYNAIVESKGWKILEKARNAKRKITGGTHDKKD